ncbi:helix-turn-helix transcriptional regulator [Amycolatopsis sp. NPDC004378]
MADIFETTDPDVASTLFNDLYSAMRLSVPGTRHSLRIVQHHVDQIRLDRMTLRMDLDAIAEPLGAVAIAHVRNGHVRYQQGRDEHLWRRGDVLLTVQPDAPFHATQHDLDVDYALIPPQLFDQITGAEHPPVRLLAHRPYSPTAGRRWWRTYAFVHHTVADPDTPRNPLVTAQCARLLAAATLAAFPNTAIIEPTVADRRDAHPDTLRRGVAFIEAHPHLDLTVTDIAGAACVTVRAIQLAFRRHLDTTPMAYLRRVRLDHAHHDLLTATHNDTVTSIAARWGFPGAGNFAAAYRAAYGQPPSRTLNR